MAHPRRTHLHRSPSLRPLDAVYRRAGIALPQVRTIAPSAIPPPYRSLLVHESDMTFTLERHFGGRVALRVLSTFRTGRWYFRRVLLVQEYSGRPVEMGAIRIDLSVFSRRIRAEILRSEVPLGRVLRDGGVDFRSEAQRYLAITPGSEMLGVFWMRKPRTLYGRQTRVLLEGAIIGDIVEILPRV